MNAILNRVSTSNNQDIRPYWNGQVAKWSQKLWLPTASAASPSTLSSIYSSSILQNSWFSSTMRPSTSTNFPKISLPLSAECKEEEQLCTEENGKRKITKTINTRSKKKKENPNNSESNIINQNISKSFTEKDPEEMAWVNEICL